MGLREKAYAAARSRGLAPQDAYDAVDEETAAGPSSGESVPLEQFMSMVEKHRATAKPESTAGEIGEPVQAPERMPPPAPNYKAPSLPEPMRMPKAPPPEPQESSADRLAAAIDRQNRATKWRGVSDALYAATAATPLQPMQSPDFASQESALEKARGADTAALMKKALGDPRSPESMRARALLEGTGIGQTMKQRLGPKWDEFTATSLPEVGDIIRAEAAKKEGADKPGGMTAYQIWQVQHTTDKEKAEAAQLDFDRKVLSKELGIDASGLSRQAIDDIMGKKHTDATEKLASSNFALASAREARDKAAHEALSKPVPYAGGSFVYKGGGTPRAEDVNEVQKISAGYGAAIAAMNQLEGALTEWANNPGMGSKNAVVSKVQVAATALNSALGQGAMADNEKAAVTAALGSDIMSPTGIAALAQRIVGDDGAAARAITQRLNGVRQSTQATARAKAEAYNFQFQPRMTRNADGSVNVYE